MALGIYKKGIHDLSLSLSLSFLLFISQFSPKTYGKQQPLMIDGKIEDTSDFNFLCPLTTKIPLLSHSVWLNRSHVNE